jgi:hypothetical protein
VRFEDLKLNRDENNNVKVTLNISKETLAQAPDYKLLGEQPWWKARPRPIARATSKHLLELMVLVRWKPGGRKVAGLRWF